MKRLHVRFLQMFIPAVFCSLGFIASASPGWLDHAPVPVNSAAKPGAVNPHYNSGGRRIVRVRGTTIVICPHVFGERTYRSVDNGRNWSEIGAGGTFSGCLVSGPNEIVYHFYRQNSHINMVRFRYNRTPPAPVHIFSGPDLRLTDTGVYRAVNATVDVSGGIYMAAHWGRPDRLYLLKSIDGGNSWRGPYEISSGTGPWFYPHLEVTRDNMLVCTYHKFMAGELWFAKSSDMGISWERVLISNEETHNPAILPVGTALFVFAQSSVAAHKGLVFNYSGDAGTTWSGWRLIDPTCGYADPSPALGSDGKTIYVAYRSSNGTGISTGSCGNRSRSRLVMSKDMGRSWQIVDHYYDAERTGTRFQVRYQTWWNYGGPLEWIWMQYEDGGANRPIYYDINEAVKIFNISKNR